MGRFTLRLPQTLHQELEARARQEGVSLNQYVVYSLTRQVSDGFTIQVLPEESVLRQKAQFDELLKRLGEPSAADAETYLSSRETAEPEEELTDELIDRVESKIADK